MRYDTTYSGYIEDARGRPIPCPRCRLMVGHTVTGVPGRRGRLRCKQGHVFDFPRGVDARQRLIQASFEPNRRRT